jgi:hypothetical protein
MDIYDEFPSTYFKATELVGKRLTLTIAGVEKRELNDGKVKPALLFEEDDRVLILNVENRTTLVERFGRDTDGWVGKKVTLVVRTVQGPNGPCPGIRFADPPMAELLDDDLPDNMTKAAPAPAPAKKKRAFK